MNLTRLYLIPQENIYAEKTCMRVQKRHRGGFVWRPHTLNPFMKPVTDPITPILPTWHPPRCSSSLLLPFVSPSPRLHLGAFVDVFVWTVLHISLASAEVHPQNSWDDLRRCPGFGSELARSEGINQASRLHYNGFIHGVVFDVRLCEYNALGHMFTFISNRHNSLDKSAWRDKTVENKTDLRREILNPSAHLNFTHKKIIFRVCLFFFCVWNKHTTGFSSSVHFSHLTWSWEMQTQQTDRHRSLDCPWARWPWRLCQGGSSPTPSPHPLKTGVT